MLKASWNRTVLISRETVIPPIRNLLVYPEAASPAYVASQLSRNRPRPRRHEISARRLELPVRWGIS